MSETTREIPTLKDFFDLKTLFFIIIAFGIMLVYFLITTQEQGGLNSIVHTLITASILFIVGGVLLNFCTIVIDVLIWRLLLSTIGIRSSFLRLLNVYMTSLVSGILIPSGGTVEIGVRTTMGRGFYNHFENRNATSGEILSSIALHRLIGTLCFLPVSVLAAIGIAVILEGHLDPSIGLILVVLVALFAFCLTLLIFSVYLKPDLVIRIVNAIPIINNQKPAVENFIHDYNASLSHLMKHKGKTTLAFCCALLATFISFTSGVLIIYSIDNEIPVFVAIFVIFLAGMLLVIPLPIPGMEGIKESVVAWIYNIYKPGNPQKAAAISLMISFTGFYLTVTLGLLVYLVTRYTSLKKEKKISPSIQ